MQGTQRFFTSTRGRIIKRLRRASHTIDELAQVLGLTDNAVRAHLATLERDGLVKQRGVPRGSKKPSSVYSLAPEAEQLLPKPYGTVLHELVEVLSEHMPSAGVETLLRELGRRLAARWSMPLGDPQTRLETAVAILNELGGMVALEMCDDQYCIRGYSCPLAAAVPGHPEVCRCAETFLTELIELPIQAQCDASETPQCCFVVQTT